MFSETGIILHISIKRYAKNGIVYFEPKEQRIAYLFEEKFLTVSVNTGELRGLRKP
jgi:hypothetical protein